MRGIGIGPAIKVGFAAVRAVERHDATFEVGHRTLCHVVPHLVRIECNPINDHFGVGVINRRMLLAFLFETMDMDPDFLRLVGSPHDRRVRAPDLNATGVVGLADLDAGLSQFSSARSSLQAMPKLSERVSYPISHIGKLASTAVALVPSVRMNGEPVPVKMRKAALRASHFNGLKTPETM